MPGLVLGALGGGLGDHFGSQGRLAQKKTARYPKNDRLWASILGSIFDNFRILSMLLCARFFESPFWWLPGPNLSGCCRFFHDFLLVFWMMC